MKKGFTLIEMIVYLALFSLLIIGFFTSVYSLIEGSNRTQSKVIIHEEAEYVFAKIKWALGGRITVQEPLFDKVSLKLSFFSEVFPLSNNPVVFMMENGGVLLQTGGTEKNLITNSSIIFTDLSFAYLDDATGRKYILVKFKVDKKYERKLYLNN